MNTRELTEKLSIADPSGELECCIGNSHISHIDVVPAFYDGALEVLVWDKADPSKIRAAKLETSGKKVRINSLSIEAAIYDNPEMAVDIRAHDNGVRERLEAQVTLYRSQAK